MELMMRRAGVMASVIVMACAGRAFAYVDLAPTLGKVVNQSQRIAVVQVTAYDGKNHEVTLKEIKTLKGDAKPAAPIVQELSPDGDPLPRQVRIWSVPGSQGVMFSNGNAGLVCVGEGWYAVRLSVDGMWKMGDDRPDLPLAYYGSMPRLVDALQKMLAGQDAVITMVPHGQGGAASFELALNRPALPGLVRLQRLRANLTMPDTTVAVSTSSAYVIGPGVVDEDDLPGLVAKLKTGDAQARVGAAEDVGTLGVKGAPAAGALAELLGDGNPRVSCAAAAALLRVDPKEAHGAAAAVAVMQKGLASADAGVRRDATREAGLSGAAGAPLAAKLAELLKDNDEGARMSALEAIATLGPAAGNAEAAVEPLLDDPEQTIDAADALGRMGLAARPAMGKLARLIKSDDSAVQWAGIRAMSQIGGPESKPAVDFIVAKFAEKDRSKQPTEVEGYNMMVYLAMLGPDAREALSTAQSGGIKNPALNGIATWALQSDQYLPWQQGGGGGRGFGGRGGGPGMGGGRMDIGTIIYVAYVREMGPRLAPAAKLLAHKIAAGTAGDVPDWGYDMLACGGDEAVKILTPLLTDSDQTKRERALVALGFMREAAESAESAVRKEPASDPQEKLLAAWTLRAIHGEEVAD